MKNTTRDVEFFELKGQIITKILPEKPSEGDFYINIYTEKHKYILDHEQDCCEDVRLIKVIGNLENIVGEPITLAETDSKDPDWYSEKYYDCHTWSIFYLETKNGRVEFYFLGESNGYYGESVDLTREDL